MTIRVHGETYDGPDDLRAAIETLKGDADNLASDSPQHQAILQHIARLSVALADATGEALPAAVPPEGSTSTSPEAEAQPDESEDEEPAEDGEEPQEVSHICPMCGGSGSLSVEPRVDTTRNRCETCDGFGMVYTGSRVEGHEVLECQTCQGQGWTLVPGAPVPDPTARAAQVPEAPGAIWNPVREGWDPPPDTQPPWAGATWDSFYGKWS